MVTQNDLLKDYARIIDELRASNRKLMAQSQDDSAEIRELRDQLATARDEALEEAAKICERRRSFYYRDECLACANAIRAAKTKQVIP